VCDAFLSALSGDASCFRADPSCVRTPDCCLPQVLTGPTEGKASKEYREFEEECQKAFNVIRKHSPHLINLFQLVRFIRGILSFSCSRLLAQPLNPRRVLCAPFLQMLSTGIPELQQKSDINYLQDSLEPTLTDAQASAKFKKLIKEAVSTKTTQANDMAHILAHR